jgi:serine/threonine protein kinase
MEFLNGGTLDSLSKNKRLNENQVKFYAAQIICGISYLHGKHLVHG